jgi:hypothetical protein
VAIAITCFGIRQPERIVVERQGRLWRRRLSDSN